MPAAAVPLETAPATTTPSATAVPGIPSSALDSEPLPPHGKCPRDSRPGTHAASVGVFRAFLSRSYSLRPSVAEPLPATR